jgi:hypothetical protein
LTPTVFFSWYADALVSIRASMEIGWFEILSFSRISAFSEADPFSLFVKKVARLIDRGIDDAFLLKPFPGHLDRVATVAADFDERRSSSGTTTRVRLGHSVPRDLQVRLEMSRERPLQQSICGGMFVQLLHPGFRLGRFQPSRKANL